MSQNRRNIAQAAFPGLRWEHCTTSSWARLAARVNLGVTDEGRVWVVLDQLGSIDSVCLVSHEWRRPACIRKAVRSAQRVLQGRADAIGEVLS